MVRYIILFFGFIAMTACTPHTTLEIKSDRLVADNVFQDVFSLDYDDPIPAPTANKEVFDLSILLDGTENKLHFENLGGDWHGASTSMFEHQLYVLNFVLNTDEFSTLFPAMLDVKSKLLESGFEPHNLPDTVSNVPDLDLSRQVIVMDDGKLREVALVTRIEAALMDRPENLSKLGFTLFRLKRGSIEFSCDIISQMPEDTIPAKLGEHSVRAECSIVDASVM